MGWGRGVTGLCDAACLVAGGGNGEEAWREADHSAHHPPPLVSAPGPNLPCASRAPGPHSCAARAPRRSDHRAGGPGRAGSWGTSTGGLAALLPSVVVS